MRSRTGFASIAGPAHRGIPQIPHLITQAQTERFQPFQRRHCIDAAIKRLVPVLGALAPFADAPPFMPARVQALGGELGKPVAFSPHGEVGKTGAWRFNRQARIENILDAINTNDEQRLAALA
jgi:hypothetical protein